MCRAPARPVCACFVRSCCRVVVQEHDLRDHVAMQRQANLFFRLHTALFSPRTSHFALHTSCTSPFTLHSSCSTPHFITTHLISALPIPLWRPRLHTTNFYTQQAFTQRSFYTQKAFTHSKLLHTESFLHTASLYTQQAFTQRGFLLHTEIAKRKKNVFEALFERNFEKKLTSAKIEKICCQITSATLMQSLQYNSRLSAAKDNSMTQTTKAPSNQTTSTRLTQELPFIAGMQPIYTEKHKVSCSGFLPKTQPMQHSCSYYNAFCSTTRTSMQPLQCDWHPHVAEHQQPDQGRTDYALKRSTPHPPHRRLHTEKHQVSCSGFLPKTSPGQQSCSHYNAFCSNTWQTRISVRTWQNKT